MPITQEMNIKIRKLSSENKNIEIINFFKTQLNEGTITAEEVLEYAQQRYFFTDKSGKVYVINAFNISRLGIIVASLEDEVQQKIAVQFYKLAAERGSSWGNRNYAECLLAGKYGMKKSSKEALEYARKSVELTNNIPTEKHEHKFILAKMLRENKLWQEANVVLIEYLEFKFSSASLASLTKNTSIKKRIEDNVNKTIALLQQIIDEFTPYFEDEYQNATNEECQANLLELKPIIDCQVNSGKFLSIKQSAYFFQGLFYEKMGENSSAWLSYCFVNNKQLPYYKTAIEARKALLKKTVHELFDEVSLSEMDIDGENKDEENSILGTENPAKIMLSQGIPLPVQFAKNWQAQASWFNSVNKIALDSEYNKRRSQVEKLITLKNKKLTVLTEIFEDLEEDNEFILKKEVIKEKIEILQKVKSDLEKKYTEYLPETRNTIRRYGAESNFFNPKRSNKIKEIIKLVEEIIDHRFSSDGSESKSIDLTKRNPRVLIPAKRVPQVSPGGSELKSVNLTKKSARVFITAERVFQEAVLQLSGKKSHKLGIPMARENSWRINYSSGTKGYGPIEHYQVGDTDIQAEHRTSPKRQRLGDSFLPQHGTYDKDIYPFLSRLTNGESKKEKKLAQFMIRYGQSHQSLNLSELQTIYEDADEADIHHFHRVCFLLMEKEQAQWHSATEQNFQLGMSVAQARCLIMISEGYLSLAEAFKNNVLFGVYSHTGIINNSDDVAKSCKYIDDLYMAYLKEINKNDYLKFFKANVKESDSLVTVLTREQAHLDMKYVYGGDSDTDEDEGYDSDLSFKK